MNITIVVDRYYPHIGGIESYIRGLSGQLTGEGHQITILSGPAPNSPDVEILPEASIIRTPVLKDTSSGPQSVLDRSGDLTRLMKTTSPDVVFANGNAAVGAVLAAQSMGAPVVYGCHGLGLMRRSHFHLPRHSADNCRTDSDMPVGRKILSLATQALRVRRYRGYRSILDSADAQIGVSNLVAKTFGDQTNTSAIYPGVDLETFRPVEADAFKKRIGILGDYVLAPGRLDPVKGQIDALLAVHESNLDLRLVIAGNATLDPRYRSGIGSYGRSLQKRAQDLGIADRIVFTGLLSQAEMVEAYSGAVATISLPVWAEPFGYAAAESMACGTPVIVANNSGVAELVNDEVGQRVPRRDHVAVARALERVVLNSDELGVAARRRVMERLSWPNVAAKVLDVFERVQKSVRSAVVAAAA